MSSPYEGTRLGDVTLCADCGFAIQLRRVNLPVHGSHWRFETHDIWEHFRSPITPHPGHPKVCLGDHEFYGDVGPSMNTGGQ